MAILTCEKVFVVWRWECNSDESDTISDTSIASVASTQSHGDSDGSECANDGGHETDPESFESTQVTHTVTFKCIGCTREHQYQETLALAHQLLKQNTDVPVRLFHEENNRYDSRALAIQCQPGGGEWKRIGYIVKEALEETHKAILERNIMNVKFGWIKFITDWRLSGPGFFAGINITRRGDWSPNIIKCSSHRN